MTDTSSLPDDPLQAFKAFVLATLAKASIRSVAIPYEGAAGDSKVECIDLFGHDGNAVEFPDIGHLQSPLDDDDRSWTSLADLLHDFAGDVINALHDDDNTEDASGSLTISVGDQAVMLERHRRVMHTDTVEV